MVFWLFLVIHCSPIVILQVRKLLKYGKNKMPLNLYHQFHAMMPKSAVVMNNH